MKKSLYLCAAGILLSCANALPLAAQAPEREARAPEAKSADKCDAATAKEESSVTEHAIKLGGQTISYKATASTTMLKNEKSESTGLMYSTAYTSSAVTDFITRPIAFRYDAGPVAAAKRLRLGRVGML